MIQHTPQCDDAVLRRYLAGQLQSSEEAKVVEHLDACTRCQMEIESLAATAADWQAAGEFLKSPSRSAAGRSVVAVRSLIEGCDTSQSEPERARVGETRLEFLAPTDDPEMLGRLGPYEIKGLVGQGGMGLVLKAYDRALARTVAIKVLSPHLATNANARRRFAREAQAAAAVAHEHVIAIHAVAETAGLPYLVMPYMPGGSLQHRLDESGALTPVEALRIASQIAAGLAAAHAQGLVHRDIKPANILLEQGIERVAISDFGLARAIDDASLTRSGVLAGTPAYMSPEQARGETVDHRADLFSLGSVMYAMCTGRPPFRAESTMAVLKRICEDEPTPLCELTAEVPPWLARIVGRLHAKSPADRFGDAAGVADLLQRCLAHVQNPTAVALPMELEEPKSRRGGVRSVWGTAAAGCLAAAVVGTLVWNRAPWASSDEPGGKQRTTAAGAVGDAATAEAATARVAATISAGNYQWLEAMFANGHERDLERLYQWSLRMVKAEALADEDAKNEALRQHLERMRRLETLVESRGAEGYKDAAAYYRVEAEKMLEDGVVNPADEW
jgi:serine/threonine-protein kinase